MAVKYYNSEISFGHTPPVNPQKSFLRQPKILDNLRIWILIRIDNGVLEVTINPRYQLKNQKKTGPRSALPIPVWGIEHGQCEDGGQKRFSQGR